MVLGALAGGCKGQEAASCGVRVEFVGAEGKRVTLEIENVSTDTVQIGSSARAAFVDSTGHAMVATMNAGADDWFMPFSLPASSKRKVEVTLGSGGDPAKLDRIEIPNSGSSMIPMCTVKASGLAH